jgi:hypothetical protein
MREILYQERKFEFDEVRQFLTFEHLELGAEHVPDRKGEEGVYDEEYLAEVPTDD